MKWQAWCVSLVGTLVATWMAGSPSFGAGGATAGPLKVQSDDHTVTITNKQQLVLQYQFNPVPFKPCIKRLVSPAGVNILRDAPPDHAHHHALMFAIAADGVNFWEEVAPAGRQVHRSFVSHGGKANFFSSMVFVTEQLDWVGPENQTILQEQRSIRVHGDKNASLLTWQTRLTPAPDRAEVKLGGSHYFGLGMRFVESMDKGGQWTYAPEKAAAEVVRGDERLIRADWCAYTAKADGKDVTVAIFDHPDNPRHPAYWFTMNSPFAYLSATANLWKEPMVLKKGQTLNFCYGVALWDGAIEARKIQALYQHWLDLAKDAR